MFGANGRFGLILLSTFAPRYTLHAPRAQQTKYQSPTFGLHPGDAIFTPLYCDDNHLAVATKKNGIYNVTPQLELKSQYSEKEIYYALTYDDNYFCISDLTSPASFLLVTADGVQTMRFADDTNCVHIAGGKIFAGSRDSLRWMQSK